MPIASIDARRFRACVAAALAAVALFVSQASFAAVPVISGTPPTTAVYQSTYSFTPRATDAQGVESEALFAQTVPQGSKDSGPWMGAGQTIIVRNPADDTELARATVASIPCQ